MKLNNITPTVLGPISAMLVLSLVLMLIGFRFMALDVAKENDDALALATQTTKHIIDEKVNSLSRSARIINNKQTEIYQAIAKDDNEALDKSLARITKMTNIDKYLFTDMQGSKLVDYLGDIDDAELQKILDNTRDEGSVQAYAKLDGKHIYQYNSVVVVNGDDEEIGIFLIIGFQMDSPELLQQIKEQSGLEVFAFDERQCLGTTANEGKAKVELTSELQQKCYKAGNDWQGDLDLDGNARTFSFAPLIDANKKTIGTMALLESTTLIDGLKANLLNTFLVVLIFLIVAYTAVIIIIMQRVVKPISTIMESVQIIATGDLTQKIPAKHACEEVKVLALTIREMRDKIIALVKPIIERTNLVSEATRQLSDSAMALSQASNRQAASIEEISSSMEEMTSNIQQNTANSLQTDKLAKEVNGLVVVMRDASNNSYNAIKEIAVNTEAINELVSQTNILSLNASVEAARAGNQGKGFAVVAKEVGRLAEQTHTTADDINETASASIHEAELANTHVTEIVPKIEEIVSLISEITTASVEQNSGVGQVNGAIADLNKVTQENAAASEEIAASTSDMQRQLDGILQMVKVFKLN